MIELFLLGDISMKFKYYKIIFMIAFCYTQDQQACDDSSGAKERMHEAIAKADEAVSLGRIPLREQINFLDEAIMWRYQALGSDDTIDDAMLEAKRLYYVESKAKKPNHVVAALLSQAIVAFLHGKGELGEKYISESCSIKNRKFEKKASETK